MDTCKLNPPILAHDEEFNCELTPCENLAKQVILLSLADNASEIRLENVDGEYRFFCRVDNVITEMVPPPQDMVDGILQAFRKLTNTLKPHNRNRLKLLVSDGTCVVQTLFLPTVQHEVFLIRYRAKQLQAEQCLQIVHSYWDAKNRIKYENQLQKFLRLWNWILGRTKSAMHRNRVSAAC